MNILTFCLGISAIAKKDLSHCLTGIDIYNAYSRERIRYGFEGQNVCPDKKSMCPSGSTCCELSSGGYGCCPIPNAVCCSDHFHCCPEATTCNLQQQTCLKSDGTVHSRLHRKEEAVRVGVECPDQASMCPTGTTCCKLSGPGYGCCPMPSAVCCSDHVHCCPHGATCDTAHSRCIQEDDSVMPWMTKTPATSILRMDAAEPEPTPCGRGNCSADATCCGTGRRASCCPFTNGVCCRDGQFCCPGSFRCRTGDGKCEDAEGYQVVWTPAQKPRRHGHHECPDASRCPQPSTCCRRPDSHHFSCCPHKNGVCCAGFCCAPGYTCGAQEGQCLKSAYNPPAPFDMP